jgi:hypothetical protein
MPWLVVEGAGSWSPNLGREWVDDDSRFPPAFAPLDDAGEPKRGYWKARGAIYRAGAHQVDEDVAELAVAAGFAWLIVLPDDTEPVLEDSGPPTGMLVPEDFREAKGAGVRLKDKIESEPEPEAEPDAPVFEHECRWCSTLPRRTFPSNASLARHIEFEHPAQHSMGYERAIAAAQAVEEEKALLRRMSDHDKPVPIWDREAVAQAGLPPAVAPDPTVPEPLD